MEKRTRTEARNGPISIGNNPDILSKYPSIVTA